jgi:Flp pilus assembly protein TadG
MQKRHPFAILRRKLRRFIGDGKGVAAVEFALILPPLLVLYVGSIEASSLITVDRRVQIISGTVGDLVARWDPDAGAIPQATLDDYFTAADAIMYPDPNYLSVRQRVNVVFVDADGDATVVWSCVHGGAQKRPVGDEYDLDPQMTALVQSASGYVVTSETYYDHTPVLGLIIQEVDLRAESFYLPRFEQVVNATC